MALRPFRGWRAGGIVEDMTTLMRPTSRRRSDKPAEATPDLRQIAQPQQVDEVDAVDAVDEVEEAGNESFPASDPPSWWAGEG
jgi:hypothetical protein